MTKKKAWLISGAGRGLGVDIARAVVFYIGTLLGVVTYPIWIILLGRQLIRARGF